MPNRGKSGAVQAMSTSSIGYAPASSTYIGPTPRSSRSHASSCSRSPTRTNSVIQLATPNLHGGSGGVDDEFHSDEAVREARLAEEVVAAYALAVDGSAGLHSGELRQFVHFLCHRPDSEEGTGKGVKRKEGGGGGGGIGVIPAAVLKRGRGVPWLVRRVKGRLRLSKPRSTAAGKYAPVGCGGASRVMESSGATAPESENGGRRDTASVLIYVNELAPVRKEDEDEDEEDDDDATSSASGVADDSEEEEDPLDDGSSHQQNVQYILDLFGAVWKHDKVFTAKDDDDDDVDASEAAVEEDGSGSRRHVLRRRQPLPPLAEAVEMLFHPPPPSIEEEDEVAESNEGGAEADNV